MINIDFYRQLLERRMSLSSPACRKMCDIAELFAEKKDFSPEDVAYFMYRCAEETSDHIAFQKHNLRYDITQVPPRLIGNEFIKTAGHFHPKKGPHGDESYPEVYQILSGEAIFLLQKNTPQGNAREIIAIDANIGDIVYIPPDYGHVMINPGDQELVNANIVCDDFQSIYGPVVYKKGLAVYCTRQSDTHYGFIPNPNYDETPAVRNIAARDFPHPLEAFCMPGECCDIYELFLRQPEAFSFLN